MSNFDIDFPFMVNYGNANKEVSAQMDDLTTREWSPFNGQKFANVFIFCMAYGFAKGKKPENKTIKAQGILSFEYALRESPAKATRKMGPKYITFAMYDLNGALSDCIKTFVKIGGPVDPELQSSPTFIKI